MLDQVKQWFGLGGKEQAQGPDVTWLLLPPYDIPGTAVIGALLVENQGDEAAERLFISLTYPSERLISHKEVISDAPYTLEGGSPRDSHLALSLPRLRAGGKVVVYVAGHDDLPPEVVVAFQEKREQ